MRLTSQQVADLAVAMSAAVRTYEKESAAAESDPANLGRQHYREQLARLRELQALLSCADIEVTKLHKEALLSCADIEVTKLHKEADGSLGIRQGEHIGNAIDALRKERDELATRLRQRIARGDFAEMRLATLAAELETERERHRQTAAVPQSLAMVRLSAQQASDLIGAIQDAAAHALGFSQALAVAGQTDSALHFEHQRARLAELERLLTDGGKRPVAVELV